MLLTAAMALTAALEKSLVADPGFGLGETSCATTEDRHLGWLDDPKELSSTLEPPICGSDQPDVLALRAGKHSLRC